jgi:NAD-dependent deacetylase
VERKLVVFSGAGLSADSGIPTFRSNGGLWHNHNVDQVANGLTWKNNWDTVRKFYNDRRRELGTVEPNAMHRTVASWQERFTTAILTQNIDNLLERAGCEEVVHLHGKLTEMKCEACGHIWEIGYNEMGKEDRCTHFKCNSLKGVRPHVVFFHEHAPNYAIMYQVFRSLTENDCVVVIGTSGQVIDMDSFLCDFRGLKILNNLEPSTFINEAYYNHVLYKTATDAAEPIDQLVTEWMTQ